jgi:DNA-binding MarR family transcriptional regulator
VTAARTSVETVLRCYPKIYFACHMRHVKDEETNQILSASRAGILDHLDELDGMEVHRLARHLGVTSPTMSINLDRLEKAGYVHRTRSSTDARRVEIRLTKAGVRIKQKQKVLDPDLVQAMLNRLSPKELQRALAGLELLASAATRSIESGGMRKNAQES